MIYIPIWIKSGVFDAHLQRSPHVPVTNGVYHRENHDVGFYIDDHRIHIAMKALYKALYSHRYTVYTCHHASAYSLIQHTQYCCNVASQYE